MEIHLDRRISEKRVFPAININRSGTRKEEYLTEPEELQKMWVLRKVLHPMDELAAVEFLLNKLQDTKTNTQFFEVMKRVFSRYGVRAGTGSRYGVRVKTASEHPAPMQFLL